MADDHALWFKGLSALLSCDQRSTNRRIAELLAIPVAKVAPLHTEATSIPTRRQRPRGEVQHEGQRLVPVVPIRRPGQQPIDGLGQLVAGTRTNGAARQNGAAMRH
jgi:hypothetical protein